MLFDLKNRCVLFAAGVLSVGSLFSTVVWADVQTDKLVLKSSAQLALSKPNSGDVNWTAAQRFGSVLVNLEFFRGVALNLDPSAHADIQNRDNLNARKSEENGSMIKAVFGGLQIALKENLSLVYSPGRMSRQVFDSDSQGLYLLTDRGGQANWYIGIESESSGRSSEVRRTTNSAQFGVILSLD